MPTRRSFRFNSLERETLLLVEGIEDAIFFNAFLCHLKRDCVQIAYVEGKPSFPRFLRTISKPDILSRLRRLGLVVDADRSADSTFESLHNALKGAQLPAPSRAWEVVVSNQLGVSLAILPDGSSRGNLEDLCLRSIKDSSGFTCVDKYVECRVGAGSQIADNRMAKSKVHTYLAIGKEGTDPGLRLGEAAEAGVWDWEAPAFRQVVEFLQDL